MHTEFAVSQSVPCGMMNEAGNQLTVIQISVCDGDLQSAHLTLKAHLDTPKVLPSKWQYGRVFLGVRECKSCHCSVDRPSLRYSARDVPQWCDSGSSPRCDPLWPAVGDTGVNPARGARGVKTDVTDQT